MKNKTITSNAMALASIFSVVLGITPPAFAGYMNVDVDVDVTARVQDIRVNQQVGTEKLLCVADNNGPVMEVRIIRKMKTTCDVRVSADARASASARASMSVYGSCSQGHSYSASDSAYGSDSDSDSDSAEDRKSAELEFAVARASARDLFQKGFLAFFGKETNSCDLQDTNGNPVEVLKAMSIVWQLYAEEMARTNSGDSGGSSQNPRRVRPTSSRLGGRP